MRFSYLVTDFPEFVEIDVNPLLVGSGGTIAVLDARMSSTPCVSEGARSADPGGSATWRSAPIRRGTSGRCNCTTAPRCCCGRSSPRTSRAGGQLHARSSPETIWARFQSMFKEATHDMAMRFCFLDYDRDLSIVAEVPGDPLRQLIGVASLSPTRITSTPSLPSWFPTTGRAGASAGC